MSSSCLLVLGLLTGASLPDAAKPSPEPGLELTIEANGDGRDTRISRLLALRVPRSTPPASGLEPGPFRATWRGFLDVEFFDDYTFSAQGNGSLRLEVDGVTVFEARGEDLAETEPRTVELEGGRLEIVARYESPPDGDARLRVLWSSYDFPPEPISPALFRHASGSPALEAATRVRRGREIVATRRCLACHAAPEPTPDPARGMPELRADAPRLDRVGNLLRPGWVAAWLQDPSRFRPEPKMPAAFATAPDAGAADGDRRAHDLAAYLDSLRTTAGDGDPLPASPVDGGELFDDLGCIGCHSLRGISDPRPRDEDRLPLDHLAAKWRPTALAQFLRQPDADYAWIRMPNFRLTADEANGLAGFLLKRAGEQPLPLAGSADAGRGRELLESAGCLGCHSIEGDTRRRDTPDLAAVIAGRERETGCLARSPGARGEAPDFRWSPEDHAAVLAFLGAGLETAVESLGRRCLPEFAEREIDSLRCTACHERDGRIDTWSNLTASPGDQETGASASQESPADIARRLAGSGARPGDEKPVELDQSRPPLTWAGEKLRTEWLETVLAGRADHVTRPWLRARMPDLSASAGLLAEGMALQHGVDPRREPPPSAAPELAAVGRRLASREEGFSCNSCHDVGEARAFGVFDAQGPDFRYMSTRLRKEFFDRWMLNPPRMTAGTKMPQFGDDEGRSSFRQFYDGDARRQFEALWNYLLLGESIPPPTAPGKSPAGPTTNR